MEKLEMLNEIFRICVIPLLGILTTYLVRYIQKKSEELKVETDNELIDKYITILTEIVSNCVIATNQTYVENLKNKNAFDAEAQKIAFEKTKEAVMALLTDEAKNCLTNVYGDLGILVNTLIESQVALNKSYYCN